MEVDIKSSDFFHLLITATTIVGWTILFWTLLLFHEGRPEMTTVLTKLYQIEVRQTWLAIIYDKIIVLLWFCAGISMVGIALSWHLRRLNQYNPWVSQLILLIVCAVAILVLTIWRPLME